MKSKTLLYLVVFIVLAVAAYFLTSDRGEKTTSYDLSETRFFEIDSAKVDKIEIKNIKGDVVLSKATGEWRIESPFQYRTVSSYVEGIVSGLKNLKIESIVSTNPEKKDTYGFTDDNQSEVSVYENGVLKGKFIVGSAAPGGISSYIKKPDSETVYLADGIDKNNYFRTDISEWKDKNIISIPQQGINSIEFNTGGENFTVAKNAEGKFAIGSDTVSVVFSGILNALQNYQTKGFSDTTLTDQTAFTDKVIVDWGTKTQINFLKIDSDPVKYLVLIPGDQQIYELDDITAKTVLKSKKEILGK